mmetsp:Transcript_54339/g.119175  ORF Transcript_54339/g.119175 Transcript_54339/m.119175 type:complete len:318 (-) Transcript_54339:19-972(-)
MGLGLLLRGEQTAQHAHQSPLTLHQISGVHLQAATIPNNSNHPILGQALHVVIQIDVGQVLQDVVHGPVLARWRPGRQQRDLIQLVKVALLTVVQHVISASVADSLHPPLSGGGPDHEETRGLAELDRSQPDGARGTVHQQGLARAYLHLHMQRSPGGLVGHPQRGTLLEGNAIRQWEHVLALHRSVRGVGPGTCAGKIDSAANADLPQLGADLTSALDLNYLPCPVRSRGERQWRQNRVGTCSDIRLNGVHAESPHSHQDLPVLQLRHGGLLHLHHLRGPELMYPHCLHAGGDCCARAGAGEGGEGRASAKELAGG